MMLIMESTLKVVAKTLYTSLQEEKQETESSF